MPLLFIKRSEVGVALLFFDKEREGSGVKAEGSGVKAERHSKKRERLTHCNTDLSEH